MSTTGPRPRRPLAVGSYTLRVDGHRDDDPIFIRRRGYPRYVYNAKNPVGRALLVGSVVFVIGFAYHLFDGSRWSEGEFREAVHGAARRLEAEPQVLRGHAGYGDLIEEAVRGTGKGPEHTVVRVEEIDGSDLAGGGADVFEIGTDDVDTSYCVRLSPPRPEPDTTRTVTVRVTVDVREGPC